MTENEITSLLLKLADTGITGIKVHYDGSGDSGCIEEIQGYKIPNLTLDSLEDISMWSTQEEQVSLKNNSSLEDFLYTILEDVEDWYNNEGGYGYISILIPSGEYHIENFVRIVDTEMFIHNGNLIQKSCK